jgi:hypothetical protein
MDTSMKLVLIFCVAAILGMLGMMGKRYNDWVSHATNPYDEVGIELHKFMPGFVQDWGCGKLKARFGPIRPPLGCSNIEGKWKI